MGKRKDKQLPLFVERCLWKNGRIKSRKVLNRYYKDPVGALWFRLKKMKAEIADLELQIEEEG
jgi:hypothetical protein|tara:strand:- start:2457 stop:2645 length:189 start_codon:yes stop_codon:yes gene_type:complete